MSGLPSASATIALSQACVVRIGDMHSLIDVASGQRINPAADIVVCDHVWVGLNVMVLKGAEIGMDSVIGMNAIVTQTIPPGCLVVGTPARVIRRGITWSHDLV